MPEEMWNRQMDKRAENQNYNVWYDILFPKKSMHLFEVQLQFNFQGACQMTSMALEKEILKEKMSRTS